MSNTKAPSKSRQKLDANLAKIAQQILDAIDDDPGSWTKPWASLGLNGPQNAATGKAYNGGNWLMLAIEMIEQQWSDPRFATYKQWQGIDCQVRKGEQGTPILRISLSKCCKDAACDNSGDCGNRRRIFFNVHVVFNRAQVDGDVPELIDTDDPTGVDMTDADQVKDMFKRTGATCYVGVGSDMAAYSPTLDIIHMPHPAQFDDVEGFTATMAHEHCHWTGHKDRLNRDGITGHHPFGSAGYAAEELVAELGALFTCSQLGVEHRAITEHAAYIQHWLRGIDADKRGEAVRAAATKAAKAAEYLTDRITAAAEQPEAIAA